MKVAVIFGGTSTEHEVSIVSGTAVIENLDKNKYDIMPIYIDRNGIWYKYMKNIYEIKKLELGQKPKEIEKIKDVVEYLKKSDVVFPVLHGLGGEDGTIQGMIQLIKKPFVGCGVLASSIAMDKAYTKIILEKANVLQANYIRLIKTKDSYKYIDEYLEECKITPEKICKIAEEKLKYPMFVKPSNSGSSVGISKVENSKELVFAIENAAQFDKSILVEEGINGREVECALLGNEKVIASSIGEVIPADKFYSFEAKYNNIGSKVIIPANISKELSDKVKEIAIKTYKAINGRGFARADFFIQKETNDIYLNEINTIPGFTEISMYPKLMENIGIKYEELLDKLIQLAVE